MEICVLGSSSAGNCTLVRTENTTILIDLGFYPRYIEKSLSYTGIDPKEIDAVLITHEHTDHIRGAESFFRKYRVPFVMNKLTFQNAHVRLVPALFENFQEFTIKELHITPITVKHDSSNPVAYLIEGEKRIGVATDLGSTDLRLKSYFRNLDAYVFESNHDTEMLSHGTYPRFLKKRIVGDYGHLSNKQCGNTLKEISSGAEVFLAHMSENNNTPEKAKETVEDILGDDFTVRLTFPKKVSEMIKV
jgi:phosphoribosyl 1,2-cyclic phosphodiesterase